MQNIASVADNFSGQIMPCRDVAREKQIQAGYLSWYEQADELEKQVFFQSCIHSFKSHAELDNDHPLRDRLWRRYIRLQHDIKTLEIVREEPVLFLKKIYSQLPKLLNKEKTAVSYQGNFYRCCQFEKNEGKPYFAISLKELQDKIGDGKLLCIVLEPQTLKLRLLHAIPMEAKSVPEYKLNVKWYHVFRELNTSLFSSLIDDFAGYKDIVKSTAKHTLDKNAFCAVFKYYKGGDLYNMLEKYEALMDTPIIGSISLAIAEQIAFLHAKGIAHRDIKGENVVFGYSTKKGLTVKLIDFEFTSYANAEKRRAFVGTENEKLMDYYEGVMGTAGYLAPELLAVIYNQKFKCGDVTGTKDLLAADIWSLGCLLYSLWSPLLTPKLPLWFEPSLQQLDYFEKNKDYRYLQLAVKVRQNLSSYTELGKHCTAPFDYIIWRCFEPNPALRITMPQLLKLIYRALPDLSAVSTPLSAQQ